MALMFQRLARNFVKNGYFPTDANTLEAITAALEPSPSGQLRILDPCCGEGVALAECAEHLGRQRVSTFGVEVDQERAWHAKRLFDACIHGDFQDVASARRRFGLLFLNPPYGDLVADQAQLGTPQKRGRQRLEKLFYQRTNGLLQFDGVMVLIVPDRSLDKELSTWIATHFRDVACFRAAEDTYRQVVIFGVRRRAGHALASVRDQLLAYGLGDAEPPTLPTHWPAASRYVVPAATDRQAGLRYLRMDATQLASELSSQPGLWAQFDMRFNHAGLPPRPPLRALTQWHLALSLAAGQVAGVVEARDGRTFVIKGATHKDRETSVEHRPREDGSAQEIRTLTDRFVPVIRALDFTPGPGFGRALTIR